MSDYYNDFEPYAAQWLRELVRRGEIPKGVVDARSILEVSPRALARFRRIHLFAGIGGWALALKLAGWPDDVEVFTASLPCFPAGTLILLKRGFVPIEEVVVGDEAMTHERRWRRVSTLFRSRGSLVRVKGQGHWGLLATPDHPFRSRAQLEQPVRLAADREWTSAKDMPGRRWECATGVPFAEMPAFPAATWAGRRANLPVVSPAFFRFLGFFVGNGWADPEGATICDHVGSAPRLRAIVEACGLSGCASSERTGDRLRCGSTLLGPWLLREFGKGARNKRLPPWLFSRSEEERREFLEGLLEADGHAYAAPRSGAPMRALTTASRALAVGFRMLLNSLGMAAGLTFKLPKRGGKGAVIEGRRVNEAGFYRVSFGAESRSFKFDDGAWGRVRSAVPVAGEVPVFNFEVEEDNSYVADGIVVHNCQPFSNAGSQRGFDDRRHLWPVVARFIGERRPRVVFMEQVASKPGLLWLDAVAADLEREGYAVGPAVLPAASVGAPHLRYRQWIVAAREREGREQGVVQDDALLDGRSAGCGDGGGANGLGVGGVPAAPGEVGRVGDALLVGPHAAKPSPGRRGGVCGDADARTMRRASGKLADASGERRGEARRRGAGRTERLERTGADVRLVDPEGVDRRGTFGREQRSRGERPGQGPTVRGSAGSAVRRLEDADGRGLAMRGGAERIGSHAQQPVEALGSAWADAEWVECSDGKLRPTEPGSSPLAYGISEKLGRGEPELRRVVRRAKASRASRLKGYGNAIVPQVAAAFIAAAMEALGIEPERK